MRIASLQPSVTLTLAALGALDSLCAHTKYCLDVLPELAERQLPVLADSWTTNTDEITAVAPDLVIASVPYRMESLAAILKAGFPLLALAPHTLADVVKDTRLIAAQVDRSAAGETLIAEFQETLESTKAMASAKQSGPRVYCEEWGKPMIQSQPWIAELVAIAGGQVVGESGKQTTAEAVASSDPDVLIFAWCGAGDRVPLHRVVEQRNWQLLHAVREAQVYCIPDEYLNTPAIPSLTEGLKHLSHAIHPDDFVRPLRLISLTR
jgi:iron complex transport system substrate-binding protein